MSKFNIGDTVKRIHGKHGDAKVGNIRIIIGIHPLTIGRCYKRCKNHYNLRSSNKHYEKYSHCEWSLKLISRGDKLKSTITQCINELI